MTERLTTVLGVMTIGLVTGWMVKGWGMKLVVGGMLAIGWCLLVAAVWR